MGRQEKILSGRSDANIRFDDACYLLQRLGFTRRVTGSHFIFQRGEFYANLQNRGIKIPSYQVAEIVTPF